MSLLGLRRQEREIEISDSNEHRSNPSAESAEVLVENRTRSVGERLLRQFVETLVGCLDCMLRMCGIRCIGRLDCEGGSLECSAADRRTPIGQLTSHTCEIRCICDALNSEHDLDLDCWSILEFLFEVPLAIRRLAPRGPIERDVSKDSRRSIFTREPVTRFPTQVTEEDIDVEVLFESLALEKGALESVAEGADDIGEDVIEHHGRRYSRPDRVQRELPSRESATMAW